MMIMLVYPLEFFFWGGDDPMSSDTLIERNEVMVSNDTKIDNVKQC